MNNEYDAKQEIITLLDNSPLSQDQMNLAIKEVIHYYNLENYIVKQFNDDVDVLDNKLDSANEKITELEFGIKVIENELDAAQEKISELSEDVETRAKHIIEIASDLSNAQHLLELMTKDRDCAVQCWDDEKEYSESLRRELEFCEEIFGLTLKFLKAENGNGMPIEHIEHRLRTIKHLLGDETI